MQVTLSSSAPSANDSNVSIFNDFEKKIGISALLVFASFSLYYYFKKPSIKKKVTYHEDPYFKFKNVEEIENDKIIETYVLSPQKTKLYGKVINYRLEGVGIIKHKDGRIEEGFFKLGVLDGKGKITFPDGKIWEGDFKEGQLHGQGRMTFGDGDIWEGNFEKGMLEGEATKTFSGGISEKGIYCKGQKIN